MTSLWNHIKLYQFIW